MKNIRQEEEKGKKLLRNIEGTSRSVRKEEGEELLQEEEQLFPCSHRRTVPEQISTLQPTKEPMLEQTDIA